MIAHWLTRTFAALLVIVLVAPSAFLLASQKARAFSVFETNPVLVGSIVSTDVSTALGLIKATLTSIHSYTSAIANEALVFNAYVLQPLAFVMSGNLLKALTAGVISFVVGAANGTGAPQFVQNLQGNLQKVGDARAMAFFVQFGRNSNSPFAAAISSSLRTNYLQNTSLAGFWAANRSTLPQFSSNVNAFLAGDWSKGGTAAWFALTTQPQNNPYMLYQASQSQLASLVANATAARLSELNWGQGFLSWCGATAEGETGNTGGTGKAPGDACEDDGNGNRGVIKTPGSTIKAALDKVLGVNQDKLVQLGQLANQVGQILGNVATVFQTVNFAQQILGGAGSGGLFGIGQASATGARSPLMQYQNAPGYLGVTQGQVYQDAAKLPAASSDPLARINDYELSWNTIRASATAAATAINGLVNFCTVAADTLAADTSDENVSSGSRASFISASRAQATEARAALTTVVTPIIARADAATKIIADARAMVAKVQSQLTSGRNDASGAYIADVEALRTMPPTTLDGANAQQEARAFGRAVASPDGSLNVSGGSLIDQMNLVSTNAAGLKASVCVFVAPTGVRRNSGDSD